jgi:hypothetical protein
MSPFWRLELWGAFHIFFLKITGPCSEILIFFFLQYASGQCGPGSRFVAGLLLACGIGPSPRPYLHRTRRTLSITTTSEWNCNPRSHFSGGRLNLCIINGTAIVIRLIGLVNSHTHEKTHYFCNLKEKLAPCVLLKALYILVFFCCVSIRYTQLQRTGSFFSSQ